MNNKDDFLMDDLLFHTLNLSDLTDEDSFVEHNDDFVPIDDDEFNNLINGLKSNESTNEEIVVEAIEVPEVKEIKEVKEEAPKSSLDLSEKEKFEMEKELAFERLRIEREEFEIEKAKFERYKSEWETLRKLSEESFQAEQVEFERQKQLEKEKMYLETREIINSCASFKEFIDDYKKIRNASE